MSDSEGVKGRPAALSPEEAFRRCLHNYTFFGTLIRQAGMLLQVRQDVVSTAQVVMARYMNTLFSGVTKREPTAPGAFEIASPRAPPTSKPLRKRRSGTPHVHTHEPMDANEAEELVISDAFHSSCGALKALQASLLSDRKLESALSSAIVKDCAAIEASICLRSVLSACLLIACKLNEEKRHVLSILCVVHRAICVWHRLPRPYPLVQKLELDLWTEGVKDAERDILMAFGFAVNVLLPHKCLPFMLKTLSPPADLRDKIAQTAWNFLNDGMCTRVVLSHAPNVIACASVLLSARCLGWYLPEELASGKQRGVSWTELFGVSLKDAVHAAHMITRYYHYEGKMFFVPSCMGQLRRCRLVHVHTQARREIERRYTESLRRTHPDAAPSGRLCDSHRIVLDVYTAVVDYSGIAKVCGWPSAQSANHRQENVSSLAHSDQGVSVQVDPEGEEMKEPVRMRDEAESTGPQERTHSSGPVVSHMQATPQTQQHDTSGSSISHGHAGQGNAATHTATRRMSSTPADNDDVIVLSERKEALDSVGAPPSDTTPHTTHNKRDWERERRRSLSPEGNRHARRHPDNHRSHSHHDSHKHHHHHHHHDHSQRRVGDYPARHVRNRNHPRRLDSSHERRESHRRDGTSRCEGRESRRRDGSSRCEGRRSHHIGGARRYARRIDHHGERIPSCRHRSDGSPPPRRHLRRHERY